MSTRQEIQARRDGLHLDKLFALAHPPGYYNEAACVALLRQSQREPHDQLLVDFSGPQVLTELTAAGRVLWSSLWNWQATVDGHPLQAAGPWREVCWHTDADVDYLELELPLTDGWKLERQFVLGRHDRFVLLADAILGHERSEAGGKQPSHEIRYASTIPLGERVAFAAAAETREAWLVAGRKRSALLLPLALPEWRSEFAHADLAAGLDGTVALMQAAQGRALYAPLWIDLDPARAKLPVTWRRLTVAESLEVQPRDVAAGFRVQIGGRQWLVYRSLAPRGNRTVLGQNYSSEFVCCRFLTSGRTESIIEVQ
ncbi:MAG: hypothetical protein WD872_06790 [Pirellulaceae bacterium]